MFTTKETIRQWFIKGKKDKATHMIVVCDTFDYTNYPVYVYRKDDVIETIDDYSGRDMQRIEEVYSMDLDMEEQLAEEIAYHI